MEDIQRWDLSSWDFQTARQEKVQVKLYERSVLHCRLILLYNFMRLIWATKFRVCSEREKKETEVCVCVWFSRHFIDDSTFRWRTLYFFPCVTYCLQLRRHFLCNRMSLRNHLYTLRSSFARTHDWFSRPFNVINHHTQIMNARIINFTIVKTVSTSRSRELVPYRLFFFLYYGNTRLLSYTCHFNKQIH